MIETTTKYICDYCKNEVSYTEYADGAKIGIRVELENPNGGCGQVAGQKMNICKGCSEKLGIINTKEYHSYTYWQGRLEGFIERVKIKIVDMFYKKTKEGHDLDFEMLEYGDTVDLENGDLCVYIRKELDTSGGIITQELNLVNIFTGEEINIHQYKDNLEHDTNPGLNIKRFAN